jgi:membrane protease subunit (stomatin/prohibitin family)
MQVVQHVDPTGQALVARVPAEGTQAIQLGSQLIVEESQQAVFLRDGKALDTFGPGRHMLTTANLPLLTKVLGIPFGGKSPFQAATVFVSTKTFLDLKWGTKEPVVYRDEELEMVRLRAFGKFAVRVGDAQTFVHQVVGTMGLYNTDGVESYYKDVIVARLTDLLGETLRSIFDLPANYDEIAVALRERAAGDFEKYGLELVELVIGAITPPEEVQKRIDERAGMAVVGDVDAYLKYKAAKAVGDAAEWGGEGAGAVGAGLGAGIGMMMPRMMQESMSDSAPEGRESPPPAAQKDSTETSPCSACGASLAPEARFCSACSAAVTG